MSNNYSYENHAVYQCAKYRTARQTTNDDIMQVKWNTNLMQHCAGFISVESLYMFRAQAPIIRSI